MKVFILLMMVFTTSFHCVIASPSKPFSITHIDYPYLDGYISLFGEIYTELGYSPTLIPTPSQRGLILVDSGAIDADVIRLENVAEKYSNVIVVQPTLGIARLILICAKDKLCDKQTLLNKQLVVLAPDNAINQLQPDEFQARRASTETISNVPMMLKAGRYDYGLFVVDELMAKKFAADLQLVTIKQLSINHVIHKKHTNILPLIEAKLREKLPEFKQARASL